ncbi:MAG: MCP four helix bundle domain-containing protein [Oligoflexia bacterium]|nr:MCP four helix bundle domain-containing protein [Oligoflexia bacterium]
MFFIRSYNIKTLATTCILVLVGLLLTLGMISLYQTSNIVNNVEFIVKDSYPKVKIAHHLMSEILSIKVDARNVVTKLQIGTYKSKIENSFVAIEKDLNFLERMLKTEQGKRSVVDLKEAYMLWKKNILDLLDKIGNGTDPNIQTIIFSDQFVNLENKLIENIEILVNFQENKVELDYGLIYKTYTNSKLVMISAIIISFLFGIVATLLMFKILKSISSTITTSLESMIVSSHQISEGNHDLALRTEESSSTIEKTSSILQELTSAFKQNTDNTSKTLSIVESSVNEFKGGEELSSKVKAKMHEINSSSEKIAEIVGMVQEIAFQTNILAINAAIEAAKAGELGQGFAVVAIEVRDLAQRSQEAAKEIKILIENSVQTIIQGSKLVEKNDDKIHQIAQGSRKVLELITDIAATSKEQSEGIVQISKSVIELDSVTQRNSTLVEQISSAGDKMKNDTHMMSELLKKYIV